METGLNAVIHAAYTSIMRADIVLVAVYNYAHAEAMAGFMGAAEKRDKQFDQNL
jgi:hypothetical protein